MNSVFLKQLGKKQKQPAELSFWTHFYVNKT